jgi:Protein kinase domain
MASVMATPASTGLVLGRFRPLRPLGSGGSGSVWLARDETTGGEVALKIVARDGKAALRAEREAAAAGRLRHPAAPRVHGIGHDDDHVYLAHEYVPGRTLRDAIRGGAVDDATAVEVAAQLLEVLAHAHARGIVHRDVKPSNVLLADEEGVAVKLLDFGLARMDTADTLTAVGDVPGTLAYIAPERLAGEPASPASDVWSVGVLLWEALAGEHPFWRPSLVESARAIEEGAPLLGTLRPDLPKPLLAAVDRSLHADAAQRPRADRLASTLRDARRRRPRPAPPRERGLGAALRPRLAPAGLAGLAGGLGAAALPFYPTGWALAFAAAAALAALARPRFGLAVALLAPVLPLGNHSQALAVVYGVLALAWLAAFARDPLAGLLPILGAVLAPFAAVALLPLAAAALVRSAWRRALAVAGGVAVAAVSAGIRGEPLPLTGDEPPSTLGVAGSEDVAATATALWDAAAAEPGLVVAGCALAAAAAALPYARARGAWALAAWGAATLAAALVPVGTVEALPVVLAVWVTCVAVWLEARLPARGARQGGS